jgi:replicative DNA helicase
MLLNDPISEQIAVGMMVNNYDAALKGVSELDRDCFDNVNLRIAFDAIKNLVERNSKVDIYQVNGEISSMGKVLSIEDLVNIEDKYYFEEKFDSIIEILIDRKNRRTAMKGFKKIEDRLMNDTTDFSEIVKDVGDIYSVKNDSGIITPENYIETRKRHDREKMDRDPIYVNLPEIDDILTTNFGYGEISILAARPQNGKSALKSNFIVEMAKNHIGVANYALEQTPETESERIESLLTGIPAQDLARSYLWSSNDPRWSRIYQAREEISKWNYHLIEGTNKSFMQIKNELRALKRDGLRIAFFDLFDRIKDVGKATVNKAQVVSSIMNSSLEVAKELKIHLCYLVQINREAAKKKDKRPALHELKESGAYEEYARVVMLLHYEAAYQPELANSPLEVSIAKQNNGRRATFQFNFDPNTMKVTSRESSQRKVTLKPKGGAANETGNKH